MDRGLSTILREARFYPLQCIKKLTGVNFSRSINLERNEIVS